MAVSSKRNNKRDVSKAGEKLKAHLRRETSVERCAREDEEDRVLEEKCEKWCAKGLTFWMLATPLVGLLSFVCEFFTRPAMAIDPTMTLVGQTVVVAGGCGGIGSELTALLVAAGASVVLGCRDVAQGMAVEDRAMAFEIPPRLPAVVDHGQLSGNVLLVDDEEEVNNDEEIYIDDDGDDDHEGTTPDYDYYDQAGSVITRELKLDSFASVREFAASVVDNAGPGGVQLLINAAGTTDACTYSEDGNELALQVNYLSHFLLADLLVPSMQAGVRASGTPARIVSVVCESAFDGKLKLDNLNADVVVGADDEPQRPAHRPAGLAVEGRCDPSRQYAASKLAQLAFSDELERRLRDMPNGGGNGISAVAVDPGDTATSFFQKGSANAGRQSLRAKVFGYLPPVWIVNKVAGFVKDRVVNGMRRAPMHSAAAIFHVATHPELGQHRATRSAMDVALGGASWTGRGGGLYSDTVGPFTNCGRPAADCGRMGPVLWPWSPWQFVWSGPKVKEEVQTARDSRVGNELWLQTQILIAESESYAAEDTADGEEFP